MNKITNKAAPKRAKNCQIGVLNENSINGMISIKNIAIYVTTPPMRIYFAEISNSSMKYVKPKLRRE